MKKWLDPLIAALIGVKAHKLRSFLTMLGIVIGVAAVIALMSIGKGTQAAVLSNIQGLGTNLLFLQPGSTTSSGGIRTQTGSAQTLTVEDASAIYQQVSNVMAVAPSSSTFSQVVYGSQNLNTRITGVTPDYQLTSNLETADGNFISKSDYLSANKVAVIGPNVKAILFDTEDPMGQQIRTGTTQLRVIGVLKSKGTTGMGSTDDAILIPLSTMFQVNTRSRTTTGQNVVSSITIQIDETKNAATVTEDITTLLRYRHRLTTPDNDFSITSQEDIIKTITDATAQMTFLLGAIAAISLLVGGIGVMNIMLVSVIERTREIGIRKALGAEEMEIIVQFLIEAALLCIGGGLVGIALGWGTSILVSKAMSFGTLVTPDIVILAFSISVAIGLIFGLYPAWRGSRLNPIEALRYE